MDTPANRPRARDGGNKPPERKGPARPRGEPGNSSGGAPSRSGSEPRRKRPAEGRYLGWGDGLSREFCARAERFLPATFPVASHSGVATIPMAVVARRDESLLLCNFSHCGAHVWADGEIVAEHSGETTGVAPSEHP